MLCSPHCRNNIRYYSYYRQVLSNLCIYFTPGERHLPVEKTTPDLGRLQPLHSPTSTPFRGRIFLKGSGECIFSEKFSQRSIPRMFAPYTLPSHHLPQSFIWTSSLACWGRSSPLHRDTIKIQTVLKLKVTAIFGNNPKWTKTFPK